MPALIIGLLPSLISLAEGLFPKSTPEVPTGIAKRDFVLAIISDIMEELESLDKLPPFLKDNKEMIEKVLGAMINSIVAATKK